MKPCPPLARNKLRLLALTGLTLASLGGQAWGNVVTSVRPLGFIAAAIADGVTSTEVLLPDGASPHDFALRPSDVQRLKSADLVIWVGPEMEAFLTKPLAGMAPGKVISLAELPTVTPLLMKGSEGHHQHEDPHQPQNQGHPHQDENQAHDDHESGEEHHHHGEYNMHIWLSPDIARQSAIAIHDRLLDLMPEKKRQLDDNLRFFDQSLTKNDKNIATMLAPVSGKGYFVFHDAYGYFETHYGLTPLGYFTVNPEIQPGAQALHKIRTQLVEQKATCIFAEPQFRPAVINAVAKGTSVHTGTLDPLGMGIALDKGSYANFLLSLSNQYVSCLEKNI
nr:zinc ABC transporter substrate-binding protein ZnuA [Biostraticola tofi]